LTAVAAADVSGVAGLSPAAVDTNGPVGSLLIMLLLWEPIDNIWIEDVCTSKQGFLENVRRQAIIGWVKFELNSGDSEAFRVSRPIGAIGFVHSHG